MIEDTGHILLINANHGMRNIIDILCQSSMYISSTSLYSILMVSFNNAGFWFLIRFSWRICDAFCLFNFLTSSVCFSPVLMCMHADFDLTLPFRVEWLTSASPMYLPCYPHLFSVCSEILYSLRIENGTFHHYISLNFHRTVSIS